MNTLTKLFTMSDMNKLKQELTGFIELKDYKTVSTLLLRI